jgi:hypothetical protein
MPRFSTSPLKPSEIYPFKNQQKQSAIEVISDGVLYTLTTKRRVIDHGYKEVTSKKESSY